MTTKTKTFALGTIEYRMPNVIEGMRVLGKIGLRANGIGDRSEFEVIADLMEQVEPFVLSIKCEKDGTSITSWAEAVTCMDFVAPLSEIAGEIMDMFKSAPASARRKKS